MKASIFSSSIKISFFLLGSLLLLGCGKDSGTSRESEGALKVESPEELTSVSEASSVPPSVGAFILNSGAHTKAFGQGLALANISSMEFKILESSEGNSPDDASLKSVLEKGKAPVVIYWDTDDIIDVAPLIASSEAVGFVAGDVTDQVIPLGANIFGFGYSTELTFAKLAKFAGNTLKSYRFAILTADAPRFELQSKVFIEETKSLGNTIVFQEKLNAQNSDYASVIARAMKENCDTLFAALPSDGLVKFIQMARNKKFKGKIIVGDTLFAPELSVLASQAEGIYLVQAWSDDANLKSQYSAKFGSSPDNVTLGYVALGLDTANCLQANADPLVTYEIKSKLLSSPCRGLTGDTMFTGERIAKRRKSILTVTGGNFAKAE